MLGLLQPILMVAGLLAWFITKNRRWAILTIIGVAWFLYDIAVIVAANLR